LQPKRPRINPLILALALAAVLMVWSVMGSGSGSTSGSTMSYSTVVHYFEHNQVTAFTLDRNTSVITLNLKEGDLPLPDVSSTQSTTQATGGLLSGMFSTSSESTGAVQEDDGTVTVRYKLPYAYVFIENVEKYIESYDAANPDAPMTYDYTSLKETIPWMEIIFYLGMLGCTGFLLFSMMRGGVGGGGGIMNVGKAKVKDEHENKKTATFADVAGEDEEKEELKEVVEFLKSSTLWVHASPMACCSSALRAPARPCWPAPVPVRPACPSTPSPARTSSRCTSAWAHPACATSSTRQKRRCPASSSLMRSMQWAVSAVPASAAATMNVSRR
jgi:cell division protease FtsH